MRTFIFCTILLLGSIGASAQTIDFSRQVSFAFNGESLGSVIDELSDRYNVRISYSPQLIPLDTRVYVSVEDMEFAQALDVLFEGTPVVYGFIGTQLVLSIDPDKQRELILDQQQALDEPIVSADPVFAPREQYYIPSLQVKDELKAPAVPDVDVNVFSREYIQYESDKLWLEAQREMNSFRAQVSLVPSLQAITNPGSPSPVNLSFNVLAGVNDNLEGFELGVLVNVIRNNMTGVQMAGLTNIVRNTTNGVQAACLVNVGKQYTHGLQLSGIANVSGKGGNVVQGSVLANVAGGAILAQVSGLGNVADVVEGAQLSVVYNKANYSTFQLGMLNFADSSDFSIGLLSFIKNGYHSFEISGEEIMHLNLNVRLGLRKFYNILHASATYDFTSWSLGYGIGASFPTGNKGHYVQLELLSRQVNEGEGWTEEMNLLNQFRITWDLNVSDHFSIAFGPTMNVMTSHRFDPDTDSYGSGLPLYTVFDESFNRSNGNVLNVAGWLGFQAGLRYNF